MRSIYDERSGGGDLVFSGELLPNNGNADPSYRLLLTVQCSKQASLYLIDRVSSLRMINEKNLINYKGVKIISQKLYRYLLEVASKDYLSYKSYRKAQFQLEKFEDQINNEIIC